MPVIDSAKHSVGPGNP